MSSLLRKNILGYELTDIIGSSDEYRRVGLVARLRRGAGDFAYMLKLRSRLLNEFFEHLNVILVRGCFRRVLFYQSLLLAITVIGVSSRLPFGGYKLGGTALYCGFFLTGCLTLFTIYDLSTYTYSILSIFYISLVGVSIVVLFGSLSISTPIQYAQFILFTLVAYTHVPVSLAFAMSLHFLLYFGLTILDSFKISHNCTSFTQDLGDRNGDGSAHLRNARGIPVTCLYLMLATTALGIYLKTFVSLRFRASFLRVCQAVHMNTKKKKTLRQQGAWIDAVMPRSLSKSYWEVAKIHQELDRSKWVFCETYDPVSILYTRFEGFLHLIESMGASKALFLVNSIFSKFDYLSYNLGCERLGALGDIYYCVCGCPNPRPDHAERCSNLALLMMDFFKGMQREKQVDLTLCIAIHTGSVNGAIVGRDRFRFDIYSYSVLTTLKLLEVCEPNGIHISGDFRNLLPANYKVRNGPKITEKRELQSAIAGMKVENVKISTFYLEEDSKLQISWTSFKPYPPTKVEFRLDERALSMEDRDRTPKPHEKQRTGSLSWTKSMKTTKSEYGNIRSDPYSRVERPPSSQVWNSDTAQSRRSTTLREFIFDVSADFQDINTRLTETREMNMIDNEVIEELHTDSKNLASLFNPKLLQPLTLTFRDKELEKQYHQRRKMTSGPVYIDSPILAPAFDSVFLFIYDLLFAAGIINVLALEDNVGTWLSLVCLAMTTCLLLPGVFLINFVLFRRPAEKDRGFVKRLYKLGRSITFIEFMCLAVSFLPTVELVLYFVLVKESKVFKPKNHISLYFGPAAIFAHCLPLDSPAVLRCMTSAVSCAVMVLLLVLFNPEEREQRYSHAWFYDESAFQCDTLASVIAMLVALLLVVFITRQNATSSRLRFYMVVEANRSTDIAVAAMHEHFKFIYNVLPQHVVRKLLADGIQTLKTNVLTEPTLVPQVGIAFIRLTNFFDGYYREDFQSGKHAIGLLNQIICMLDKRINKPEFSEVEKIKTFNDSYMVAAGLDLQLREKAADQAVHLMKLFKFCHGIFRLMHKFNDKFILGQENAFEIAIGIDVGTVCAGLMGSAQPFYHLIGGAVEVAKELHFRAVPGRVLGTENVRQLLKDSLNFEPTELDNPPKEDLKYYYCS